MPPEVFPLIQPPDGPNTPSLDKLNIRRRAFVLHYTLGEDGIRGVAYKAYQAAGFESKTDATASVAASALMREQVIKNAISEVRDDIEREARLRMKSWAVMAGKAQDLLDRALDTVSNPQVMIQSGSAVFLSTNQLGVIIHTLDRALGKPKMSVEREIGPRLEDAIRRLRETPRPAGMLNAADPTEGLNDYIGEGKVLEDGRDSDP